VGDTFPFEAQAAVVGQFECSRPERLSRAPRARDRALEKRERVTVVGAAVGLRVGEDVRGVGERLTLCREPLRVVLAREQPVDPLG